MNEENVLMKNHYYHSLKIATTVSGFVRVVIFAVDAAVVDDEFKSVIHQTSVASLINCCVAVDEFLFRESNQFSGHDLIHAFHRRNGGERPAAPLKFKDIHDHQCIHNRRRTRSSLRSFPKYGGTWVIISKRFTNFQCEYDKQEER